MRRLNLVLVAVLLVMAFIFQACDETAEDPAGPDSTTQDLVGTWVRYTFTVEGEPEYSPAADVFRSNGTGTAWYNDDGTYTSQDYTWTIDGDTLQLVLENDGNHTVMVEFLSDNRIVFSHEADGGSWVDERFRMDDHVDQEVVGDWVMSSQTHEGTPVDVESVRLVINADGTGSYSDPEESSTFTWSAVEEFLVVLEPDNQGFVLGYSVSQETLSLTEIREDGTWVMTFSPFEPPDDIDPDFVGTWVRESIFLGTEYHDVQGTITFNVDGTGTALEEWDEVEAFTFNWSVVNDTLTMTESEGEWTTSAAFNMTGNRADLYYNMEMEETNFEVHDIFYKQTGETPSEVTGTWVQAEPYAGEGYVEMEVTFILHEDGNLLVESHFYDQSNPYWEEDSFSMNASWSMSEDRILITDPSNGLGMAYQWTVSGDEAVLIHPSMGTRTFLLNEGTQPADVVGTWAPYQLTIGGELQETLIMELRLHDDGTGAVILLDTGDDTEEIQADTVSWVARDNKILLTTAGSNLCEVMDYSINTGLMTINHYDFLDEDGSLVPMEIGFAKWTDELNPEAYGTWEKTGETRNGEEYQDYDNITLVFNDDGSGTYTDTSGETEFYWSWSPGSQYSVSSFMVDGYRVSQAAGTVITGNELQMTTFLEKEGEVVTLVESYLRQE